MSTHTYSAPDVFIKVFGERVSLSEIPAPSIVKIIPVTEAVRLADARQREKREAVTTTAAAWRARLAEKIERIPYKKAIQPKAAVQRERRYERRPHRRCECGAKLVKGRVQCVPCEEKAERLSKALLCTGCGHHLKAHTAAPDCQCLRSARAARE